MAAPIQAPNVAAMTDSSDDDDISLTSTVSDDPDQEYEIEGILARDSDGRYLVEWAGYPLGEATLEPGENLPQSTLDEFAEKQRRIDAGLEEPFPMEKYWRAKNEHERKQQREHDSRHRRRNRKRKKLGLPLTSPFSDDDSDYTEGSSEAEYDGSEDEDPATDPKSAADTKQATPAQAGRTELLAKTLKQRPGGKPENVSSQKGSAASTGYQGTARPTTAARPTVSAAPTVTAASQPKAALGSAAIVTGQAEAVTKKSKVVLASRSASNSEAKDGPALTAGKAKQDGKPLQTNPTRPSPPEADGLPKPSAAAPKPTQSIPALSRADVATLARPKAKKSGKSPVGNVFATGKPPKKRRTFEEVFLDSSKEPKRFSRKRFERLAELKARDLADRGPSLESFGKAALYHLGRKQTDEPVQNPKTSLLATANIEKPLSPSEDKPTIRRNNSAVVEKAGGSVRLADASPLAAPSRSSLKRPKASSADDGKGDQPKKRRVHWLLEDDDQETKPPLVASPGTVESPQESVPAVASMQENATDAGAADSLFVDTGTQKVERKVKFGESDAPFDVLFGGITRDASQPWLSAFLEDDLVLDLSLKCTAADFVTQRGLIVGAVLSSGPLLPVDNSDCANRLDAVVETLRAGAFGLYYGRPEFGVLVYPSKCDEWQNGLACYAPNTLESEGLHHIIFAGMPIEAVKQSAEDASGSYNFVDAALRFKYEDILPTAARKGGDVGFYLLLPEKARALHVLLLHWLKDHGKDRVVVFSTFRRGSWAHLLEAREQFPWVVLIHESVVHMVSKFPQFSRLLRRSCADVSFWMLSESLDARPLYKTLPVGERMDAGNIWVQKLFPRGAMILLPQSVVVSDPENTYKLLRWFLEVHVPERSAHWRIVVPYDFVRFARSIAVQKAPGDYEDVRWKIAETAEMILQKWWRRDSQSRDHMSLPLVFGDASIDPYDEQSLVNWFASMSISYFHRFRRFYILWSSITVNSITIEIPIPRYIKGTINDPDITPMLRIDENDKSRPLEVPEQPEQPEQLEKPESPAPAEAATSAPEEPVRLRAKSLGVRFSSDSGAVLERWLRDAELLTRQDHITRLYIFPIAYLDFQMSDRLERTTNPQFRRYMDWINYTYDFSKGYNTYFGFFYTIPDRLPPQTLDRLALSHPWVAVLRPVCPHIRPYRSLELLIWDPEAPARSGAVPRPLPMSSLLYMQKELVKLVTDKAPEKFKLPLNKVWLGGFPTTDGVTLRTDSDYPLDVVSSFLEAALGDIRGWLPAYPNQLEKRGWREVTMGLAEADQTDEKDAEGAHEPPQAEPAGSSSAVGGGGSPTNKDKPTSPLLPVDVERDDPDLIRDEANNRDPYSDSDSDLDPLERRHVFHAPPHPPRPPGAPPLAPSVCRNRLFDRANAARKLLRHRLLQRQEQAQQQANGQPQELKIRGAASAATTSAMTTETPQATAKKATDGATMLYTYVPTKEWHTAQYREGRGFEHIFASDQYRAIFRECNIGVPLSNPDASSGLNGWF